MPIFLVIVIVIVNYPTLLITVCCINCFVHYCHLIARKTAVWCRFLRWRQFRKCMPNCDHIWSDCGLLFYFTSFYIVLDFILYRI